MSSIDEKAFQKVYESREYGVFDLRDILTAYEAAKASDQPVEVTLTPIQQELKRREDDHPYPIWWGYDKASPDGDKSALVFWKGNSVQQTVHGEVASYLYEILNGVLIGNNKREAAIAKLIHYPEHWDTMAYPALYDALYELAGCVGCSECEYPGKNPDADQSPNKRESSQPDDCPKCKTAFIAGLASGRPNDYAKLEHDIEAYRGALGYSVPGHHDGRLINGAMPKCGLCEARSIKRELVVDSDILAISLGDYIQSCIDLDEPKTQIDYIQVAKKCIDNLLEPFIKVRFQRKTIVPQPEPTFAQLAENDRMNDAWRDNSHYRVSTKIDESDKS